VVSIAPEATVAEAARRMHTAGVKRLPVVERPSLLPYMVRAVQGVAGVVRVENRLAYDLETGTPTGW
jgi:CBS domain-containing protein